MYCFAFAVNQNYYWILPARTEYFENSEYWKFKKGYLLLQII